MADGQGQVDSADAAEADLGEEDSVGFRHRDSGESAGLSVCPDWVYPAADDYFHHLGSDAQAVSAALQGFQDSDGYCLLLRD